MTKSERICALILKAVNSVLFAICAFVMWMMGAHSTGYSDQADVVKPGWAILVIAAGLIVAIAAVWVRKNQIIFWAAEVLLVGGFIALLLLRTMNGDMAFTTLGPAAIVAIMHYLKFEKPYIGPILIVLLNCAYIYLSTVPYGWYANYWF
ncbi:hypothetical protein [Lactobacillus sp.]|uniref:hypothetical protein n=1 Tax=Lactobacillus sp. TaxID=1591 RepID=UPI003EF65C35